MATEAKLIDAAVTGPAPHCKRYGRLHWPKHPWTSYQFRRALGETQEGGGSVSECFQAAARMVPGDREFWHAEWAACVHAWVQGARNRLAGHSLEPSLAP